MSGITMRDIGRQLGVSAVTVSKALAGKSGVSEEMRQKIIRRASELGYVNPNAPQTTPTSGLDVGILIPENFFSVVSFYATFYKQLVQALPDAGHFGIMELVTHDLQTALPLPNLLVEAAALAVIAPEKDVDGFHLLNAGRMMSGQPGVVACTPKGAMEMIRRTGIDLDGKEAVVVGRSNIVGKPMAMLLLQANCTVTICHSHTVNLAQHTRNADILVAAVGKPGFITKSMVKPGAVVIDVGINRVNGKVVGDVMPDVADVAGYITPVPGGVGKMTIVELLENTVEAAEKQTAK